MSTFQIEVDNGFMSKIEYTNSLSL